MWYTEKKSIGSAKDVIEFIDELKQKYPGKDIDLLDISIEVDSWSDCGIDGYYTVNSVIAVYSFRADVYLWDTL
jgi:hypothetical protein